MPLCLVSLASLALGALALPLLGACSRGARRAPGDGGLEAGPAPAASSTPAPSEAVFSAPIAAAMAGHTQVVAGLVVAEKVIRVRATRGGSVVCSTDVFRGAAWAPDVELRVLPAADGVAVLWGGPGASGVRAMVTLGAHGELLGEPADIGAAACATAEGIAWVDPRRTGPVRVVARRWGESEVRDAATLPADRDPALVCGEHAVFVLGDGDDDLTLTSFVPGDVSSRPARVAMRDSDFGDDDEREHDSYTMGDTLGLVRVAASGAVAMREMPRAGSPTPWRTLKHKLAADDDVVAVDGDAAATLVVYTHDAEDACGGVGSSAVVVRAVRIDRATGAETVVDLAPPDCDVSPGPFWIAPVPGGQAVAWVERSGKLAPNAPPIRRLAVRVVRADGVRPGGATVVADALVDAGCDESSCFAAALVRSTGCRRHAARGDRHGRLPVGDERSRTGRPARTLRRRSWR